MLTLCVMLMYCMCFISLITIAILTESQCKVVTRPFEIKITIYVKEKTCQGSNLDLPITSQMLLPLRHKNSGSGVEYYCRNTPRPQVDSVLEIALHVHVILY